MRTVFLDTNVFKFGTTGVQEYGIYPGTSSFIGYRNPNEDLPLRMQAEINALHEIFRKHKNTLSFITSIEVYLETTRCTNLASRKTIFDGVTIETVKTPIRLDRPLISQMEDIKILSKIKNPRFLELQKATGAFQGRKPSGNQLIDTLHIWTAEYSRCDFFLTLDLKLVRQIQGHKKYPPKTTVVSPGLLLDLLNI